MFLFLAVIIPLCVSGQPEPSDADLRGLAQRMFQAGDSSGDGIIRLAEMVADFQACDKDQDGSVSHRELQTCYPGLNPSLEGMRRAMYNILDFDGDDHLEMADFTHYFQVVDVDSNDEITETEFVVYWFEKLKEIRAPGHFK